VIYCRVLPPSKLKGMIPLTVYSESVVTIAVHVTTLVALSYMLDRDLRPVYSDTTQLNSTDLLRADWLYAVQLGQLHCRSSATAEFRR